MKAPALAPWPCSTSGFSLPDHALESGPHQTSRWERLAANGRAVNAELEARRDFRQRLLGAFAAGEAVGDDADMMAAIGLAVGEIEDMAEDAADRRARGVQDAKRLTVNERHDQNQRTPTGTSAATGHGRWSGFASHYWNPEKVVARLRPSMVNKK